MSPQYQEDFYKKVYARSEAESNKPFVAFRGDMVADPNQAQNMAFSGCFNKATDKISLIL